MQPPDPTDLPKPPPERTRWPWTRADDDLPDARWPKISIVTPSLNQGQFIEETIRSVLLQGYPNLDYIIIDGGSSDSSVDIIKRYEAWITYWVSESDRGQSHAINKGFAKATGELLGWLNSDDVFEPHTLRTVAEQVAGRADQPVMVVGDGWFTTSEGVETSRKRCGAYRLEDLLAYHRGTFLCQPAVFFTRAALDRAGPVNEDLAYSMDLDLWARMRRGAELSYVDAVLARCRRHGDAKSWAANYDAMLEVARTIQRYDSTLPPLRRHVNRLRMRHCRAMCCLQDAVDSVLYRNDRGRACRLLALALLICPGAAFSELALRTLARITLPAWLREIVTVRILKLRPPSG